MKDNSMMTTKLQPFTIAIPNDFKPVRRLAERDHRNIVSWNDYPQGGHWASQDAPDLLIQDIRQFFRRFR
jgi:hypothetical protein